MTRRRLAELTSEIGELRELITAAVAEVDTGFTGLYGLGPVGAATVLGEVADIRRYRSRHAFAAANGTAPTPALLRPNQQASAPTPKAAPTICANAPKARPDAKHSAA